MWIVYATFERQTDHDVKRSKKGRYIDHERICKRGRLRGKFHREGNFVATFFCWNGSLLKNEKLTQPNLDLAVQPQFVAVIVVLLLLVLLCNNRRHELLLVFGHSLHKAASVSLLWIWDTTKTRKESLEREKENGSSQMNEDSATKWLLHKWCLKSSPDFCRQGSIWNV